MQFNEIPSALHYTTGFPLILGLKHFENLRKIRVANPEDKLTITSKNGDVITNFGVTTGYHHYFIATRPRCMFVADEFTWNSELGVGWGVIEFEIGYKQYLTVPFKIYLNGKSPYPFPVHGNDFATYKDIRSCHVESGDEGYPNRLVFVSKTGRKYGLFLEPDLLHFIEFETDLKNRNINFRVEYIGMSTGVDGSRDFADRLWNHEKVRQLSGDIQSDFPNRQVYVFGYQSRYATEPYPGRFILNSQIIETKCGMRAWAEILEATLIKHFQPTYNQEFKRFLITENPKWLNDLREILVFPWEPPRPIVISTSFFSDNSNNPSGGWFFGGFYTDSQPGITFNETINYEI